MAVSFHVNGPASVFIDGAELGISTDGVTVEFTPKMLDVLTDIDGGSAGIPTDVQAMNGEAKVTLDLIYYDETVLETVLAGISGATLGTTYAAGTLLFTQGKGFQVTVNCTPAGGVTGSERCYTFPNAYLVRASGKMGTKASVWAMEFRALPGIPSGDSSAGREWITSSCG